MNRNRAHLLLLLTAIIWGLAFVAQVSGGKYMSTFALNFHRNLVAGLFLLVVLLFIPRLRGVGKDLKATLVGGTICGVVLSIAMALQQYGLQFTTAGKGGFITALYIILVPIGGILLHHSISKKTWLSVFIAAIGLYFISVPKGGDGSVNIGDVLIFISAIGFATHILIIDHFSNRVDGVAMSCIQFFVAAFMSLLYILPTGQSLVENYSLTLPSILYLGLLSSGVGFTLQIVGQHYSEPTIVSLILSLESVFGLIGGIFILGEVVTPREWLGCLLMFIAIVVAQIPLAKLLKFGKKHEKSSLS
ncbi:MAG: DMT family transporter [Peptoniphilus sp.]|nr:DMT family transporter [Peptoniphilus sp.]MDD7363516.1 DMT family transporter [Bacillota bacterium]MDY6044781.1 DMT family transporter [Peptoniphilus sp.]